MTEPLSDEALAALLAKATAVPLKDGATVVITSKDTSQASAVNAFLLCARPDTVAALVREVQQRRAQVRTLEADNAALVQAFGRAESPHKRGCTQPYLQPDADCSCGLTRILHDAHPGAALLAALDSLRAEVKRLTEERDAAREESAAHRQERHDSSVVYTTEIDRLRARVAQLERSASLARDAALEEVAGAAESRARDYDMAAQNNPRRSDVIDAKGWEADAIASLARRMKSTPSRRFVDAEEVKALHKVAAPVARTFKAALEDEDVSGEEVLLFRFNWVTAERARAFVESVERLGLTLEGGTP